MLPIKWVASNFLAIYIANYLFLYCLVLSLNYLLNFFNFQFVYFYSTVAPHLFTLGPGTLVFIKAHYRYGAPCQDLHIYILAV